jgi:hypothetical protein
MIQPEVLKDTASRDFEKLKGHFILEKPIIFQPDFAAIGRK